jgi:hypothetical protein
MREPEKLTLMMLMERGEIVISEVQYDTERSTVVHFITPALVVHERMPHGSLGFMLTPWIPSELTADGNIRVNAGMVQGTMIPTVELASFYRIWANTEQEKLQIFAKEFNLQVTAIEKFHIDKFQKVKERKKREIFTTGKNLPDTIIALFEDDADWGDPTVTH